MKNLSRKKLSIIVLTEFVPVLVMVVVIVFCLPVAVHAEVSSVLFTKPLQIGATGDEVKHLQKTLGNLIVDGNFGPKTKSAVMRFQKEKNITVDGVIGPITRANLNKLITGGEILPVNAADDIKATPEVPVRINIPKINISAKIENVGLTPNGAMDVPKGPDEVAWFDLGPRPGEVGSAVVSGHSGWKNDIPAVFDDLYRLQVGDRLYVEDDKGETIFFTVREIRSYDPNADAADVFGSNDGKAHLNLITCSGVWNNTAKSHSERLVVFTDREI